MKLVRRVTAAEEPAPDAPDVRDVEQRLTVLSHITEQLVSELLPRNVGLALSAIKRLENQYRLLAALRGELNPIVTHVHTGGAELAGVRAALLRALEPYPEARLAA